MAIVSAVVNARTHDLHRSLSYTIFVPEIFTVYVSWHHMIILKKKKGIAYNIIRAQYNTRVQQNYAYFFCYFASRMRFQITSAARNMCWLLLRRVLPPVCERLIRQRSCSDPKTTRVVSLMRKNRQRTGIFTAITVVCFFFFFFDFIVIQLKTKPQIYGIFTKHL